MRVFELLVFALQSIFVKECTLNWIHIQILIHISGKTLVNIEVRLLSFYLILLNKFTFACQN